jgi:hypothetical protein
VLAEEVEMLLVQLQVATAVEVAITDKVAEAVELLLTELTAALVVLAAMVW